MSSRRRLAPPLGALLLLALLLPGAPAAAEDRLDLNDVSVLFPPPQTAADLDKLIPITSLAPDGAVVWSDEAFKRFVEISNGDSEVPVAGHRISLTGSGGEDLASKALWHLAAFRIDAGAPGLSPDIVREFGRAPQIRLTLQPVTKNEDKVTVHDVTAHLIFSFVKGVEPSPTPGCLPVIVPDDDKLNAIVADVLALKKKLAAGEIGGVAITTVGKPLGVHPGLADERTAKALRDEIEAFLMRHVRAGNLAAMAVMGLPNGFEPWIFVSMQVVRPGVVPQLPDGGIVPVPSPTLDGPGAAQMLSFIDDKAVGPEPATNNLNPVTCRFNRPLPPPAGNLLPVAGRKGLSTSPLFKNDDPARTRRERFAVNAIVDTVADTEKSHFFNTDCISCHTDTHRSIVKLGSKFRNIDPDVLPKSKWNVRNFGWFATALDPGAPAVPTATRRVRTETEEVLHFINRTLAAN